MAYFKTKLGGEICSVYILYVQGSWFILFHTMHRKGGLIKVLKVKKPFEQLNRENKLHIGCRICGVAKVAYTFELANTY